ncbi:MAG: hypothetical protein AABM64_08820 [Pseudomonadota bacterium]
MTTNDASRTARLFAVFWLAVFPGWIAAAPPTTAFSANSGVVEGVTVYLGILPSEMIRGHPAAHPEASMHGGPSGRRGEHHVLIALFDAEGTRLENMEVQVRVGEVGLSVVKKPLEPMQIAGTVTYGNFFSMPKPGPYSIELDWRVKGEKKWSHAVFIYRHPQK